MSALDIPYLRECFAVAGDGSLIWRRRPREHFDSVRGWRLFNRSHAGKRAGASGFVMLGGRRIAVERIRGAVERGYDREPVRRYGTWIFPRGPQ